MPQFVIADGNNASVFGPARWSAQALGRKLHDLLEAAGGAVGSVALSNDPPVGALSWAGCPYRILPCAVVGADHDPATQVLGDPVVTVQSDAATAAYSPVNKPLEEVREIKLAALAAQRWSAECGGIVVAGASIATDDRSKVLLNGKYRTAEKNPSMSHRWKGADGEVTLTSAQIIAIGDAVSAHVQVCFDRELDLVAQIKAAGSVAEIRTIDIAAGW